MTQSTPQVRDWLSLSEEELRLIVESKQVPFEVDWSTLPSHPSFERIFRVRSQPSKVAKILLESKQKEEKRTTASSPRDGYRLKYEPAIPTSVREERLRIRREELLLQKEKVHSQTVAFEKICQLETDVKSVKRILKDVVNLLRELPARARK